jgi:hypothetical protein
MTNDCEEALAHEAGLVRFIRPRYRIRFRSSLEDARLRVKLMRKFGHFDELDIRFIESLRPRDATFVEGVLRHKGAPSQCYLVSESRELDQRFLPLTATLSRVVGHQIGSFVSCIPGRLAYFADEDAQYVLERSR